MSRLCLGNLVLESWPSKHNVSLCNWMKNLSSFVFKLRHTNSGKDKTCFVLERVESESPPKFTPLQMTTKKLLQKITGQPAMKQEICVSPVENPILKCCYPFKPARSHCCWTGLNRLDSQNDPRKKIHNSFSWYFTLAKTKLQRPAN